MPQPRLDPRPWFLACALAPLGACTSSSQLDHPAIHAVDSRRWLRPTSGVRGIFEDSKGNLYFTSPDWSFRYDPSARDDEDAGLTYFPRRPEGVLLGGFQEDSNGLLWTQGVDGIHSYDGKRFTLLADRDYDSQHEWAKSPGDLWFGPDGGIEFNGKEGQWGVYRYHGGQCSFLAFPEPPSGTRHPFFPLTSRPMQGKDGTLWFGTFSAAFGFDGQSFDIVGRDRMGRADDPRHMGIRGYHLDDNGNLWMADNGAGVYVYDGTDVIHFTAIHGLRDQDTEGNSLHRAFSIAQDGDGNFWIGTAYSGIWRYEPSEDDPLRKGTFTNYGEEQGWPCENAWTIHKKRNGQLLFGGENPGGVYRFNGGSFERVH